MSRPPDDAAEGVLGLAFAGGARRSAPSRWPTLGAPTARRFAAGCRLPVRRRVCEEPSERVRRGEKWRVAGGQLDDAAGVLSHPPLVPCRDGAVLRAHDVGRRLGRPRELTRHLRERCCRLPTQSFERPPLHLRIAVRVEGAHDIAIFEVHGGLVVGESDAFEEIGPRRTLRSAWPTPSVHQRLPGRWHECADICQRRHRLMATRVGDHHPAIAVTDQQGRLADHIEARCDCVRISVKVTERLW